MTPSNNLTELGIIIISNCNGCPYLDCRTDDRVTWFVCLNPQMIRDLLDNDLNEISEHCYSHISRRPHTVSCHSW